MSSLAPSASEERFTESLPWNCSRAILDRKDRSKASEKKSGEDVEMVEVRLLQFLISQVLGLTPGFYS